MKLKMTLVALALSVVGAVSAQQLTNGDFETGDYSPWTTWKGSTEKIVMVDKPALVHEGNYAVTVGGGILCQNVEIKAGSEVTVTFFTKRYYGDNCTLSVTKYNNASKTQETIVSEPIPENKKAYEQTTLKFTAETSGKYRVLASVGKSGGKFLMDSVTVTVE